MNDGFEDGRALPGGIAPTSLPVLEELLGRPMARSSASTAGIKSPVSASCWHFPDNSI
jgi:hypothetical protein